MEIVQGYAILKTTTFDSGHGFALGHNPGAPDPFVTWQFTEGEKGQRDYYWGRYGNSLEWAQRDFDRRVDDYQHLYHAAVKNTELGPDGVYRYYSTQRPVDIGTYPKPPDNLPLSIVNYDDDRRRPVANGRLMAWGELTYAKPLTEKQMEDYEVKPSPGNPDRVRPVSYTHLDVYKRQVMEGCKFHFFQIKKQSIFLQMRKPLKILPCFFFSFENMTAITLILALIFLL